MNPSDRPKPVRCFILAMPEASPAVVYSLHEVLGSVGGIWHGLTGQAETGPTFEVKIVSSSGRAFISTQGIPVQPDAAFDVSGVADIVIVPDMMVSPVEDPRGRWAEEINWLKLQADGGACIASVCSGSLLLACAGFLEDHRATTHWAFGDLFRRFFPRVLLQTDQVLVVEGPQGSLVTSGGSASWADMALYLIERFSSRENAVHAKKIFLLGDRSDGQLPFAAMAPVHTHDDAVIWNCQEWIADNYRTDLPVARMIEVSGLSARTFKRRFRKATGYTPIDYVQRLRIEEAKQIIETGQMPLDEVGYEVGYEDPSYFRRLFKRLAGITPASYRKRYKHVASAVAPSE